MLYGTYEHNIDGKNRIFMPAKFRNELGDDYVYRLYNADYPTIQVFSRAYYEAQALRDIPGGAMSVQGRRALARCYMGVSECSCDATGRIVLNSVIAKKAGLVKECIVVGFGSYVEIMSAEAYDKALTAMSDDTRKEEQSYQAEEDIIRGLRSEGAYIDWGNKKATTDEGV